MTSLFFWLVVTSRKTQCGSATTEFESNDGDENPYCTPNVDEDMEHNFLDFFYHDLGRRFATVVIDQGQANNAAWIRDLWGQLFVQADIQTPNLGYIAQEAYDSTTLPQHQEILACLRGNQPEPLAASLNIAISSGDWTSLVAFVHTHVVALRQAGLLE